VILIRSFAAAAALALLASVTPAFAADGPHRVYALAAQNGSGELGTVTLTAVGDKTRVDIALANAPTDVPQPAHIHEGSCAKLDPKPKYPLAAVVDGTSSFTVDAPMSQLVAGGFAVNVHKSGKDIPTYVSCGELGPKK
jgi:Cu/Zn superoxide dismutase